MKQNPQCYKATVSEVPLKAQLYFTHTHTYTYNQNINTCIKYHELSSSYKYTTARSHQLAPKPHQIPSTHSLVRVQTMSIQNITYSINCSRLVSSIFIDSNRFYLTLNQPLVVSIIMQSMITLLVLDSLLPCDITSPN